MTAVMLLQVFCLSMAAAFLFQIQCGYSSKLYNTLSLPVFHPIWMR